MKNHQQPKIYNCIKLNISQTLNNKELEQNINLRADVIMSDESPVISNSLKIKWLQMYDWLEFSLLDVMTCKTCIKYNNSGDSTFIKGNKTYRKSNLDDHANTDTHVIAIKRQLCANRIENPFSNLIPSVDVSDNFIYPVFSNLLWLAEEDIAINKCESLHSLVEIYLGAEKISSNYRNRTSGSEIIMCFSEVIRERIISKINKAPFYSIAIDESRDYSKKDNLSIIVKFISNFKIHECFLKLIELDEKCGVDIFKKVRAFLTENILRSSKLISVSSDGGGNMYGDEIGFRGRIMAEFPYLIYTHCSAHRASLAIKDLLLIKELSEIKLLIECVKDVTNLIMDSSKRLSLLKHDASNIDQLNLLKSIDVRWSSNYDSMARLLELYPSVLTILKSVEKVNLTANGAFNLLTSLNFILKLCILVDIMAIINCLIKSFQNKGFSLTNVNEEISYCIESLRRIFANGVFSGFWYNKFKDEFNSKKDLFTIKIRNDFNESEVLLFANCIITNEEKILRQRFIDERHCFMGKIFDFNQIRRLEPHQVNLYGLDELKQFVNYINIEVKHYPKINLNESIMEYLTLKTTVRGGIVNLSSTETLEYLLSRDCSYFNLIPLLLFYYSIIVTSVECERTFSTMNLIKTDTRNRLGETLLDALMNISLNLKNIDLTREQLIYETIQYWRNSKIRRNNI
jgi:hypothetical protein